MGDLGIGGGNTPPPDLTAVGPTGETGPVEAPPADSPKVVGYSGDSITAADGGQKKVSTYGYPGDPPVVQDSREYDFDQVAAQDSTGQWLNVSYSVAFVNNMQEAMEDVNQSQLTEAMTSMENSQLDFQTKVEKSEMTLDKAEAEAEKLMTSALISLSTSVSIAAVGLCTTAYSANMTAKGAKEQGEYEQFNKDYPNAGGDPVKSQADYDKKKTEWNDQKKACEDYDNQVKAGGFGDKLPSEVLGKRPADPGPEPFTPEQQTAQLAKMKSPDGSPKYIETQRQATVARAVAESINQNLGRTVPEAISNIYQAGMTVEIGQMEAAIIMMDAVASQYERQMQNARTATENLSQQITGFSQALNAVIDARKQNFSIRAN